MTVKELREALGDYEQDMRVVLRPYPPESRYFIQIDPDGLSVQSDAAGDYVLVLEDV